MHVYSIKMPHLQSIFSQKLRFYDQTVYYFRKNVGKLEVLFGDSNPGPFACHTAPLTARLPKQHRFRKKTFQVKCIPFLVQSSFIQTTYPSADIFKELSVSSLCKIKMR